MNPTDPPVQELHEKPTQQPTTTTESAKDTISSIGDSVSDLATTSWNGLKSTATNVASNEHVQNTWTQIRSATIGTAEQKTPEPGVYCINIDRPDECRARLTRCSNPPPPA